MNKVISAFTTRRYHDLQAHESNRYIGVFQLTAICTGCVIGSGIYITSGLMIKHQAGPSALLSILMTGVTTILFGLVYAEIGTRIPRSGSYYVFGYAVGGEMLAVIIGILFALSYLFGAVTIAHSLAFHIDCLCHNSISNYFGHLKLPNSEYITEYFNPVPSLVIVLLSGLFWFRQENSTKVAIFFVVLNIAVLFAVIIGGARTARVQNWHLSAPNSTNNSIYLGHGGFMPYGVSGIFTASLGAFFSFSGVDVVASIAGNVKNPVKTIPISTILSLLIAIVAYGSVTVIISLMTPYYLVDVKAPFASAFLREGNYVMSYLISAGCVFGMTASLYGDIFSGTQLLYSMSLDNLFPSFMKHGNTDVMMRRCSLMLCFSSAIVGLFLPSIMSINISGITALLPTLILNILVMDIRYSNQDRISRGNKSSREIKLVRFMIATSTICSIIISILIKQRTSQYTLIGVLSALCLICLTVIQRTPKVSQIGVFRTPGVPFVPFFINLLTFVILGHIDVHSWIFFSVIFSICFVGYLLMTVMGVLRRTYSVGGDLNEMTKLMDSANLMDNI